MVEFFSENKRLKRLGNSCHSIVLRTSNTKKLAPDLLAARAGDLPDRLRKESRARAGDPTRNVTAGAEVWKRRGMSCQFDTRSLFMHCAMVCSAPWLEAKIDGLTSGQREQAAVYYLEN